MNTPARILVADDNETNRDILATRLQANGYEVLHAADGEEALAVTHAQRPDLILLDIMMPKLDGIEVCKRLKADAALPFTPIILVTAKAESGDVVDGLDAGADEYLTKPVDQKALVARVKALLRIKERHDAASPAAKPAPANGTDLFISYSQKDLATIKSLTAVLQQSGWSVWFDQELKAGTTFDRAIEQALIQRARRRRRLVEELGEQRLGARRGGVRAGERQAVSDPARRHPAAAALHSRSHAQSVPAGTAVPNIAACRRWSRICATPSASRTAADTVIASEAKQSRSACSERTAPGLLPPSRSALRRTIKGSP